MSIEVRLALPEDDAFIAALGSACAGSSISAVRPASSDVAAASFRRLLRFCRERPGTVDLVAEVDDERAGFLILITDIPDEVTQAPQAFIAYMAVAQRERRRGVGAALMRAAETEALRRGLPHLSLMVTADNEAARALYAREGLEPERILVTKPLRAAVAR